MRDVVERSRGTAPRLPAMPLRACAGLLTLLVILAFSFQGTRGIWQPDEARYSAVALEMLRSGEWLVPHVDPQHPHFVPSLARSRVGPYVLPLFAPLALWIAHGLGPPRGRLARAALALWFVGLVTLKASGATYESARDARALAAELRRLVHVDRFDNLVFVESSAELGLELYIGRSIEGLAPRRSPVII